MAGRLCVVLGLAILLAPAGVAMAQGPMDPEHSDLTWQATYWNNPSLSGPPAMHRAETDLDCDWQAGSPDPVIPADHFSARWTRYIHVARGEYRFTITADDGIRLWVDGGLMIDEWHDQAATTYSASMYLEQGHHLLKVEYYENQGQAVARVSWTPVGPPPPLPPVCPDGYVTAHRLNVRSGPGLAHEIVSRLHRGQQVYLLGRTAAGDWLNVGLPNSRNGWVSAHYIRIRAPISDLPVVSYPSTTRRIRFEPGASSASLSGRLSPDALHVYVLRALAGQTMTVDVVSSRGQALLSISGADGEVFKSSGVGSGHWSGVLPSTQDYFIAISVAGNSAVTYSLQVIIPPL